MAVNRGGSIKVQGLDELRRELRKLDDAGLTNELKQTNFDAAKAVIAPAQARARGLGRMQARAAATLTPSKAAAGARVNFGGAKAPFAGGAEFGAGQNVPRRPPGRTGTVLGWNQFEPWRGNDAGAGYFLYPTIRELTPELVEMYGDAIERITARAFPD